MTRIKLTDTTQGVVVKMCDGNPGAMTAIVGLLSKDCEKIDPDSAMGTLGPLLSLDTLGIYGTDIYILWNDKCKRDLRRFVLLLRASQLGLLPSAKVQEMAADQMRQVDLSGDEWGELDVAVCERLAGFMSIESWETMIEEKEKAEKLALANQEQGNVTAG